MPNLQLGIYKQEALHGKPLIWIYLITTLSRHYPLQLHTNFGNPTVKNPRSPTLSQPMPTLEHPTSNSTMILTRINDHKDPSMNNPNKKYIPKRDPFTAEGYTLFISKKSYLWLPIIKTFHLTRLDVTAPKDNAKSSTHRYKINPTAEENTCLAICMKPYGMWTWKYLQPIIEEILVVACTSHRHTLVCIEFPLNMPRC